MKANTGRRLPEKDRVEICRRYRKGETGVALAAEFGVGFQSVYALLHRRGVPVYGPGASYRYACNDHFFQKIDTGAKAYWLGFLAADGCLMESGDVKLHLSEADRQHLVRFQTALDSDYPIAQANGKLNSGRTASYQIAIRSRAMVDDLMRHGLTYRKTFRLGWPEIAGPLLRHYLRGYFDGDGSFCIKAKANRFQFKLTGQTDFILQFQSELCVTCGLNPTALDRSSRPDGRIATMSYGGRLQLTRIAVYLYEGATIYLPRKHRVVECLISPDRLQIRIQGLR